MVFPVDSVIKCFFGAFLCAFDVSIGGVTLCALVKCTVSHFVSQTKAFVYKMEIFLNSLLMYLINVKTSPSLCV